MTLKRLLGLVAPYAGAFVASALTLANTDLTKIETAVMAGAPAVIAAGFNFVRRLLSDVPA
jgi:hypothetical protein